VLTDDSLRVWAQDHLSRFLETQDADSAFDEMISVLELVSSKEGNLYLFIQANIKTFTAERLNEKGFALLLNLIYSTSTHDVVGGKVLLLLDIFVIVKIETI
jgi:hypothetical protein